MQVMDGVGATKFIRCSSFSTPKTNIPIVEMTAFAMAGDREKSLSAEMDDYISKPVTIDDFRRVVERVILKNWSLYAIFG